MAVYKGTYTDAAGCLITILDAVLVNNSFWSIHDSAAGTNAKVYKCTGDGKTWYLHVNDNQSAYAILALWEFWDAGTHTGSGTTYGSVYWRHTGGAYFIVLRDNNFIWSTFTTVVHLYYVGQPILFDTSQSSPVLIGHDAATQTNDPIGMLGTYTSVRWRSIRLATSAAETVYCFGFETAYTLFATAKTSQGLIMPQRYLYYGSDNTLFGYLEGVWSGGGGYASNYKSGQRFLVDGVLWRAHYQSKFTAVRME